jgi:hypothetical protein
MERQDLDPEIVQLLCEFVEHGGLDKIHRRHLPSLPALSSIEREPSAGCSPDTTRRSCDQHSHDRLQLLSRSANLTPL